MLDIRPEIIRKGAILPLNLPRVPGFWRNKGCFSIVNGHLLLAAIAFRRGARNLLKHDDKCR